MDYDVSAVALQSPPAQASLTNYRPAILVRNNGRYPAIATGDIQAYIAGLRVYYSPVTSESIAAGGDGIAYADHDWTPEVEGDVLWFGSVITYRDQVKGNDLLSPRYIHVNPGTPTPPPTVAAHASQHEHGGSDPLDVDQLPGKLRDDQTPEPHSASHQAAGDDMMNVAGLPGVLSDPQIPVDHGNEHHNPDMATASALTAHQTASQAHTAATNLANRDLGGDRAGLVTELQLITGSVLGDPGDDYDANAIRADHLYGPTNPVHHATKHEPGSPDEINFIAVCTTKAGSHAAIAGNWGRHKVLDFFKLKPEEAQHQACGHCAIIGFGTSGIGAGQQLEITLSNDSLASDWIPLIIPVPANTAFTFHFEFDWGLDADRLLYGLGHGELTQTNPPASEQHIDFGISNHVQVSAADSNLSLSVGWLNAPATSSVTPSNAIGTIIANLY